MKACSFALILIFPVLCHSATLLVPADHSTIQGAIDAALPGDTVLVSSGTYVENIDFKGKAITVTSVNGLNYTTIDGGSPAHPDHGSVAKFINGEGSDSVLDGFSLMSGSGTYHEHSPGGWTYCGGGIICIGSSPRIKNCFFLYNSAEYYGGGMYCKFSAPILEHCFFDWNSTWKGAGLWSFESSPQLVSCIFRNNSASSDGGGMWCREGAPVLIDCWFQFNTAGIEGGALHDDSSALTATGCRFNDNSAQDFGGGLYTNRSEIKMDDCTLQDNTSWNGAGIYTSYSEDASFEGCVFENNEAGYHGGGAFNEYGKQSFVGCRFMNNKADSGGGICDDFQCTSLLTNCVFFENSALEGGGIYSQESDVTIVNCTLSSNIALRGGASYNQAATLLTAVNTIFWNNNANQGGEIYLDGGYPCLLDISHSDLEGGFNDIFVDKNCIVYWGPGMIDVDPCFIDEVTGDLHIDYDSPCISSGDASVFFLPPTDFEGDPRDVLTGVDMGADEFHRHFYCTVKPKPGNIVTGYFIGLPGSSPVYLFIGSGLLDPPLNTKWGSFYLDKPLIIVGPLGSIPSSGYMTLQAMLPTFPSGPDKLPMQALIGEALTNLYIFQVY